MWNFIVRVVQIFLNFFTSSLIGNDIADDNNYSSWSLSWPTNPPLLPLSLTRPPHNPTSAHVWLKLPTSVVADVVQFPIVVYLFVIYDFWMLNFYLAPLAAIDDDGGGGGSMQQHYSSIWINRKEDGSGRDACMLYVFIYFLQTTFLFLDYSFGKQKSFLFCFSGTLNAPSLVLASLVFVVLFSHISNSHPGMEARYTEVF